jgi:hypothetical protein
MVFLVANGGNFEQITALQRLPPHPGGMHVRLEFAVDSYAVRLSPAESAPVSHAKQHVRPSLSQDDDHAQSG